MPWFTDSLRSAIAAVNPFQQRGYAPTQRFFTPELAFAAYLSSGMLRKVIDIPAADRVREWRDWQADSDQIEKLEAEEKRLGIIAKVKAAEVLRGIGGGALILAAAGNLRLPINPRAIGLKGLAAVNVASRWQLTLVDIDDNMASLSFGEPRMFRINGGQTEQQDIHPSRVIAFRGDPIPAGYGVSAEEAYWGASRLERVFAEVQKSDNASQWFAELVKKAKLLRIGIPDLADMVATAGGQQKLSARVATIAEGESVLNATVYSSGSGTDGAGGEKITDYQITWAGIPAMMDAFDQRVAAVADIPFTRLMGRSPAGMNATGDHDTDNWNKMIAAGQKLELRSCLERLDEVLIPSAGVDPAKVTWRFAPLDTPSEKEEADTFKTMMDAVAILQNTGAIPDPAFAKGVQNLMAEREYMPGLDQALAELPEDIRFGTTAEPDDTDPSELQTTNGGKEADPQSAGGTGVAPAPVRRAANDAFFADAQPRPLYVQRKLLNAADLIAWAKSNGFKSTLPADDMHVTVLYSRTAVDLMKMGEAWSSDDKGNIRVKPGGPRAIERLGESAVVLLFASWELTSRHADMVRAGGSHDYDEYQPHVTLSYEVSAGVDLAAIKPFAGELRFGPELFEALDLDWKSKVSEE